MDAERTGNPDTLDESIRTYRRAIEASSRRNLDISEILSDLGLALSSRFDQTGDKAFLQESIRTFRDAVNATEASHPRNAICLINLGNTLETSYRHEGDPAALREAADVFQQAAQATWVSTWTRIQAAASWGRLAAKLGDNRRATDGFTLAMELLPQVTPRYLERSDAEHWLSRFAGLASDAAACALNDGDVERAVTVLELGRGVLLADTIEARGDLTELRERAPEWADRFVQLNLQPDVTEDVTSAAIASAQPVFPGAAAIADTRMNDRMSGFIGARRRELSGERDELIARIRTLSGLERFLLPPTLSQLTSQAADGPIIMINTSRIRCNAVILRPDGVLVEPLRDVTPDTLAERVRTFVRALDDIGSARFDITRRESAEQVISQTLAWLWDSIAGPVLEILGLTSRNFATTQGWPKVWWSPAGLMSFLPIHAAGHHGDQASAGPGPRWIAWSLPTRPLSVRSLICAVSCGRPGRSRGCSSWPCSTRLVNGLSPGQCARLSW